MTGTGTCSLCHAPCERAESGAWWHLGPSCWGTVAWYAAPVFVPVVTDSDPGIIR